MATENQTIGAIPALRGFRKQFLHTLHRIIDADGEVIYPETLEDFAVFSSSGDLLEIVQVKDHKEPLTFSELSTLLLRATKILKKYPKVNVILASYGKLGPELNNYIGADETKLKKSKKFCSPDLLKVFKRLSYVQLNEKDEFNSIKNYLTRFPMTIGDWQSAFDLLMHNLYRGAEKGSAYTSTTLHEYLQSIGTYLVGREAHHREWGITIFPLLEQKVENREQLREEFYEGIAASWKHISADLDIFREKHLNAINNGFKKTNIVIIHGASGQGKSALAYRYLNDYCAPSSRYEIRDLSTHKRALEVTTALAGYNVPLTFYFDASHKDKGLSEFLLHISELEHINCIVTIREEDWRLICLTSEDLKFTDLELSFNREEAKELYASWEQIKDSHFPDFAQAWAQFEEAGPLLEFIHLLTHTESLRDRLQKQYERIADEIDCHQRSEYDLKLIEYVAIAGAYGARIDLSKLSGGTALLRSIARLEKEYLLRLTQDERHLIGLHPIRSKNLASIITDPVIHPWDSLAIECLPLLEDEDLEIFLLNTFIYHPEASEQFIELMGRAKYESWTSVGGVLRALQWMGIFEYVQVNKNLIKQVHKEVGDGWWIMLDFDFIGLMEKSARPSGIIDLLPELSKEKVERWRKQQTPKSQVFKRIDDWLKKIKFPPMPSYDQERDWQELGKVAYWIGHLNYEKLLYNHLDWTALSQVIEKLKIENLAILIYGIWHAFHEKESFVLWYNEIKSRLLDRYRKETDTPYIQEQEMFIKAHFIVPLEEKEAKQLEGINGVEKNRFHALSIQNLKLLAQTIPNYSRYGCQGYGHRLFDFYENDDTKKNGISALNLTPDWVTQINKIARILSGHFFRPATWNDYCDKMLRMRANAVKLLDTFRKELEKHFRTKKPNKLLIELFGTSQWKEYLQQINKIPGLPLEALDRWGFTEETIKSDPRKINSNIKKESIVYVYLQRYQAYLHVKNEFFNGLNNFLSQSPNLAIANSYIGKAKKKDVHKIKKKIIELGIEIDRPFLSGYNLGEALKNIGKFQLYFRKHFSGLLDENELSKLEKRERETIRAMWALWYFFVAYPSRNMTTPGKATSAQLNRRIEQNRNSIKRAFLQFSTNGLQVRGLASTDNFENKPSLWITVNSKNPLNIYSEIEGLFSAIRDSIGNIKLHSIEYYALEFEWQHLIIVPLYRGKLIEKHVFVIPIYQFISELNTDGRLSAVNLVPKQIDSDVLNNLGLEVWSSSILDDPKVFFQSLATMQLRLQHLVQIGNLQDSDEIGVEIIQSYFNQLNEKLSNDFQKMIDKAKILNSQFEQINKASRVTSANEYLQQATEFLNEINDKLFPDGLNDCQVSLSINSLKNWQKNVSSVQDKGLIIYLFWCGYLIGK